MSETINLGKIKNLARWAHAGQVDPDGVASTGAAGGAVGAGSARSFVLAPIRGAIMARSTCAEPQAGQLTSLRLSWDS